MADGNGAPEAQDERTLLKQVLFIKAVTADPEVTVYGKAVANALVFTYWNKKDGYAWPGHPKIAEAAGISVTMVKRGIKSLQARGWFCVEPTTDAAGDPAQNRYYPIWKRATGTAPAGSERKRKAPRTVRSPADSIVFEAGLVRLTVAELEDVKQRVGRYSEPFLSGQRGNPLDWTEDNWREQFERSVAIWAESDDDAALSSDPPESEDAEQPVEVVRPVSDPEPQSRPVKPVSRPVLLPRQALPSLPDFRGRYVSIRAAVVSRWAAEFSNIPDLSAAMREIEPSITREPEAQRQNAMKARLRKLNDALGTRSETISPDPAHAETDAVEVFPF